MEREGGWENTYLERFPRRRPCRFGQAWEGLWSPSREWWESTTGFPQGPQDELTDIGNNPSRYCMKRGGCPSVGEERPVWRLLQSSRWEWWQCTLGVVGVGDEVTLRIYFHDRAKRMCWWPGWEMWEKDRHQRQSWCRARAIVQRREGLEEKLESSLMGLNLDLLSLWCLLNIGVELLSGQFYQLVRISRNRARLWTLTWSNQGRDGWSYMNSWSWMRPPWKCMQMEQWTRLNLKQWNIQGSVRWGVTIK